ncbi:tripartite tricarboxylate transporter substrate binding protein [Limnohabitans sp.]|uniref:Bug family tripartite tricarboxylate transporter substrate binding protein n=1 Tax=Limnohabitans sp. TaxID=1907725 RepID=UPI00286F5338|nr:tripartite tricarboxylate transporter substrate binding protein [Limnohabitans sp.]
MSSKLSLRWKKSFYAGIAVLVSCVSMSSFAQNFPNKPVKLVVTYPAGGSSDLMARIMGQKLSEHWGQPVIIESKPGAAGSIGMEFTARQPADGYTFVVGNLGPASVNPLITKVPYNMDKDFIPVALTATGPNILAVPTASPFKNLSELLTAARNKPDSLNFGTSGPGSMAHLGGELIMRQANIKMTGVPYKGGGLAVNDLLAGQIDMMVSDALPVSQHIKSGRLRALAITSAKRSPMMPDVPTFAEAGLPGLVAVNWWGVFLPAGTPKPIVDAYHSALVKIMANPDLKDRFTGLGVEALATSQDEFKAFLASENAKYSKLIADNNIKAE